MSILRRAAGREARTTVEEFLTFKDVYGRSAPTFAGQYVSKDTALKLSAVWGCVSLIADSVACLPWDTFEKGSNGRKQVPLPRWMTAPNPEITPFEFRFSSTAELLLTGNAYSFRVNDSRKQLAEAWPVASSRVRPFREAGGPIEYTIDGRGKDTGANYTAADLLHLRAFTLPGCIAGLDPISYMAGTIGNALAASDYQGAFHSNGASVGGVLEMPPETTEAEAKTTWEMFKESNQGPANAHKPAILVGAHWEPTGINPEQAMMLESQAFGVNEVCRWYRVAPHMVQDSENAASNWGTGLEQQTLGFAKFTLLPWLVRWEQAINPLIPGPRSYVKWNMDALLRADVKTRYEAYMIGREGRWLSADEVRALEDLDPLPNGQGTVYANPSIASPANSPSRDGGGTP